MKHLHCLLLIFFGFNIFGQSIDNEKAFEKFIAQYNNNELDAAYQSFDDQMQSLMSKEEATSFFKGLQMVAGSIQSYEWRGKKQGFDAYKTIFEKGEFEILFSINKSLEINGFNVEPFKEDLVKVSQVKYQLPFKEQWFVFWGGDTPEENYHVDYPGQEGAFDFVIVDMENKTFKSDGLKNEDYYAFGKEIYSPCNGEVVMVIDGIHDNRPGEMFPMMALGNGVVIKNESNEYVFLAHFKNHSTKVKEGQKVKAGDLLGLCGNSGNSSEAHLHLHVQDQLLTSDATGRKIFFKGVMLNGKELKRYSPIKGDQVFSSK